MSPILKIYYIIYMNINLSHPENLPFLRKAVLCQDRANLQVSGLYTESGKL
jgi:hypothetical protein